jgi:hypothetical protein
MKNCAALVQANFSLHAYKYSYFPGPYALTGPKSTMHICKWLLSITLLKIDTYKQQKSFWLLVKILPGAGKGDPVHCVDPSNNFKLSKIF